MWIVGSGFLTYRSVLPRIEAGLSFQQYIIVWGVITVFIFFTMSNIKKVSLKGSKLHVSNFLRSEEIEASNIIAINGSQFLNPKLIWFTLKEKSGFGNKIIFIPQFRNTPGLSKHPMIQELIDEFKIENNK
ncbi:MAG: hypothetical protein GY714_20560 [Desulfobacterales bacterium]|nr:hypothetical protein [Desulfobacterales bacterium]MCP4163275.1 hypothetical protein [Deltaproteobacteria bacterium]